MSDGRHPLGAGQASQVNPGPERRSGIGRRLVGRRYGPCDGLRRVFPTARRRGVTAPCLGWPPGSALGTDRVMIGILCQAVTVVVRALTTAQYGPSRQPYQAVSTVHHVHTHESVRGVRHREEPTCPRETWARWGKGDKEGDLWIEPIPAHAQAASAKPFNPHEALVNEDVVHCH